MGNLRRASRRTNLLLIFLLSSIGCDANKKTQSFIDSFNLNPKETLSIVLPQYPENLDWALTTDRSSAVIESNIMTGLTDFEVSGTDIRVVPQLAKWEVSEGGLKYTFKIKDGVVWTDGVSLKAQHFVDAFRRLLESQSPWAGSLYIVRGAKNFHDSKNKNFGEVGIKAPADDTLVFELNVPASYFPGLFAHHSLYPVRKDLIEKFKETWSEQKNIVTLGAYKLMGSEKDRLLILQRNDKSPLKKSNMKNIVCRFGLKATEALDLFSSGQVNAIVDIPVPDLKTFQDRDDLYFSPILEMTYLTFDVRQKPLQNPIFRRVVAMSLDRDDLGRALSGVVRPLSSMVPPGLTGYESNRGVRFDPEAAKDLQKHSGYSSLDKYGTFYLKTDGTTLSDMAALNIQEQLKKTIGLQTQIVKLSTDTGKNPTLFILHWWANVPDPDSFLNLFTGGSLNNITGWKNRNYDDFVRNAAAISSPEGKEKVYAKAQHILTETEMPVVPLFMGTEYCLLQKKVHHFPLNILGQLPLRGVTLE